MSSFIDKINDAGYDYVLDRYKQIYGEEHFQKVINMKKPLVIFVIKENNPEKGFYKKLSESELEEKNKRKDELLNMLTVTDFFVNKVDHPMYISTFYFSNYILTNTKPSKNSVELSGLGPKGSGEKKYLITKLILNRVINYIENVNVKDYLECEVLLTDDNKSLVLLNKPIPLLSMTHEHLGYNFNKKSKEISGTGIVSFNRNRIQCLEDLKNTIHILKEKIKSRKNVSLFDKLKKVLYDNQSVYRLLVNSLISEIPSNNREAFLSILTGYPKLDLCILTDYKARNRKNNMPYIISDEIICKWKDNLDNGEYDNNKIFLNKYESHKMFSSNSLEILKEVTSVDKTKPISHIIDIIVKQYHNDNDEFSNYLINNRKYTNEQKDIYFEWLVLYKSFYIFATNKNIINIIKGGSSFIGNHDKVNKILTMLSKIVNNMSGNDMKHEIDDIKNQLSTLDVMFSGKGILNNFMLEDNEMSIKLVKDISDDMQENEDINNEMKNFVVNLLINV